MANKKYNHEYYRKNKEKLNENAKNYRELKKDELLSKKKIYYQENKDIIKEKKKQYRENNKEHIKEIRKQYRLKNREKIAKQKKIYQEKLLSTDIGKLKHNIRQAIRRSLISKGYKKKFSSEQVLGCSIEEFKIYLESKFESWMNWDNKGQYNGTPNYGWDVDHITPLSSAKTEEELLKLNHFSNLQPLCSYVNRDIKKNILS
jgi:hypothetical protein